MQTPQSRSRNRHLRQEGDLQETAWLLRGLPPAALVLNGAHGQRLLAN
jgi:hypothetical protein